MIHCDNAVAFLFYTFWFTLAFAVVNKWNPKEMWTLLVAKWDKIILLILASYIYIIGTLFLGAVILVYAGQHGWF